MKIQFERWFYESLIDEMIAHLQKNADFLTGPNDSVGDKIMGQFLLGLIDDLKDIISAWERRLKDSGNDEFLKNHLSAIKDKSAETLIQYELGQMGELEKSSIKHFLEKGTVNGSFMFKLKKIVLDFADKWGGNTVILIDPEEYTSRCGVLNTEERYNNAVKIVCKLFTHE